jgi:uncharacterized protein (DUF697 family)
VKGQKLGAFAVLGAVREARGGASDVRPLAIAGASELVSLLAAELRAGGDAAAVVENRLEGIAALVWVGHPDEAQLRTANRAGVPIVAVTDDEVVPYVLAANVVHVPPGQGFPVERIAATLAKALGDGGIPLAARLPVLRGAVCDALIARFARRNAVIAAAIFVPGFDMPVLTLNEIRLVLRLALAHGRQIDRSRGVELAGVVGAGFGLRTLARELLDLVPIAGWLVKSSIAYGGTRAIGEASVRYFETLR